MKEKLKWKKAYKREECRKYELFQAGWLHRYQGILLYCSELARFGIWTCEATPNDLKLSEPRGWRDRCVVGERRRPEAAGVTAARVRCSAWLGVAGVRIARDMFNGCNGQSNTLVWKATAPTRDTLTRFLLDCLLRRWKCFRGRRGDSHCATLPCSRIQSQA